MKTDTKQKALTNVLRLHYGQLWGFFDADGQYPAYNPGRDDADSWGTPETTLPLGMMDGYDLAKGAMIGVDVESCKAIYAELAKANPDVAIYAEIAADPVAVAKRQRKERADQLRAEGDKVYRYLVSNPNKPDEDMPVDITARNVADVLDTFSEVDPVAFIVCGQRRAYAGPWSLALAERLASANIQQFEWFVQVEQFPSVAELHDKVLNENRTDDKQGYSLIGLTRNAIRLLDERPRLGETDLGRALGLADFTDPKTGKVAKSNRGRRQQLHRIARLALMIPDLQIERRIGLPETTYAESHATKAGQLKYVKGDFVPVAKLHKEDVACLLGDRKEPTDLMKVVWPEYKKGEKANQQTAERYLRAICDGEKPKGAISVKDLKTYVDVARIKNAEHNVGQVLQAIIDGDAEFFDNLNK